MKPDSEEGLGEGLGEDVEKDVEKDVDAGDLRRLIDAPRT